MDFFRRTLFIASDCAALSSTSISCCKEQSLTLLGFDKKVIIGFESEFDGYITLCRKLGRTYDFEQYRSIFLGMRWKALTIFLIVFLGADHYLLLLYLMIF